MTLLKGFVSNGSGRNGKELRSEAKTFVPTHVARFVRHTRRHSAECAQQFGTGKLRGLFPLLLLRPILCRRKRLQWRADYDDKNNNEELGIRHETRFVLLSLFTRSLVC